MTQEQLTAQLNDTVEQLAEANAINAKLVNDLAAAKEDLKAALEINDELQKELDQNQKETKTVSLPSFDHEGKKYRFTRPRFTLPGHGTYSASEAASKKDVISELIKRGSKVIAEQ